MSFAPNSRLLLQLAAPLRTHSTRKVSPKFSPNCSVFRAKKLETKSTTKKQENLKNDRVRFRLNIDVRKEKEHSWLNAIKTKIAFVKGRLNFSSKSTTAANVHLMECPLDNWLKNNYITVDMIYCLRSLLVSGIFYEF